MSIVSTITLGLRVISGLLDYAQRQAWIKAGADAEIAKVSASILQKTEAGKRLMEKLDAMRDDELDKFMLELGRSEPSDGK